MMKEEFEKLVGTEVADSDYKIIEYVYQFHPAITDMNGKKEIAAIYQLSNGMDIIRSMVPTAEIQAELEKEMRIAQQTVADIRKRMERVKNGNIKYEHCRKAVLDGYEKSKEDWNIDEEQWSDCLAIVYGNDVLDEVLDDLS